jgi:hypothetical protein
MDPASPPLGIPPLLWLLIFLIGGPTTLSLLFSRMAARIPGFAGAAARWWQSREPAARSYELQQREIKRLDEQYQRLAADAEEYRTQTTARLDTLARTVADLEVQLTDQKRRFWAAIGYIRRLAAALSDCAVGHPHPEVPEELREYL